MRGTVNDRPGGARTFRQGARGVTILETVVSVLIFMFGIVAILNYFPMTERSYRQAADLSRAALLGQLKVQEIRRDDDQAGSLRRAISILSRPTVPMTFAQEPRMAYSFSGVSLLDPDDAPGMPRVIIRYSQEFQPGGAVLFEMPF